MASVPSASVTILKDVLALTLTFPFLVVKRALPQAHPASQNIKISIGYFLFKNETKKQSNADLPLLSNWMSLNSITDSPSGGGKCSQT